MTTADPVVSQCGLVLCCFSARRFGISAVFGGVVLTLLAVYSQSPLAYELLAEVSLGPDNVSELGQQFYLLCCEL